MKSFINDYLNHRIQLQNYILNYLDDSNDQENLLRIASYYENKKISEDKEELQKCVELIACIAKNHHRSLNFYKKIEQIINIFKLDISKIFSNMEIFSLFKNNIRILHFLFNEKIVIIDEEIEEILRKKYSVYFYPKEENEEEEEYSMEYLLNQLEIMGAFDDDDDDDDDDYEIYGQKRIQYYNDYLEAIDQKTEEKEEDQESEEKEENIKTEEEENQKIEENIKTEEENKKTEEEEENQKIEENIKTEEEEENQKSEENIKTEEEENQKREEIEENLKTEEEEINQKSKNSFLEMFEQKRETGENDNIICQLIRNDDINEFISYINLKNIKLNSKIESSDFETNQFLRKNHPTIIEYTAFFGSIQIFKYLVINKCKIKPTIWIYSIHGMNPEMIHILEELQIKPPHDSFLNCFYEAIKCHHTNLSNYIYENYISNFDDNLGYIVYLCMKYQNYKTLLYLFENKLNDYKFLNQIGFLNICMNFNFIKLFHFLIKQNEIDINKQTTLIQKDNNNERIENTCSVIHIAIDQNNNEISKFILSNPKIDINSVSITKNIKKNKVQKQNFNRNNNFRLLMNRDMRQLNEEEEEENNEEIEEKVEFIKEENVLNMALERKNVEIINILLSKQEINPNSKTIFKYPIEKKIEEETSLNIAIKNEVFEILDQLISMKGIDINLKSVTKYESRVLNEKAAISLLVEKNKMDFVKKIISRNDIDINQLIEHKITRYQYSKYYMSDDDDFNDDEYYDNPKTIIVKEALLHIAIERNEMEIIKMLLSRQDIDVNILSNANVNSFLDIDNETPLFLAIEKSNIEVVKLLLAHPNIDVNKISIEKESYVEKIYFARVSGKIITKQTALHLAVERGYTEIVKLLLNTKNIDVNFELSYHEKIEEKKTALHIAILKHNIEIARLLLEKKDINVNAKYVYIEKCDTEYDRRIERTPLYMSIENKCNEITKMLLEKKNIEVNEKSLFTGYGNTKLYSVDFNYDGYDLPIEKEDSREEKTVLQIAIEKENKEMVSLLLSRPEIDVNEKLKSTKIVTNLRSHQHSITEKSTTALHIAVGKNNIEIISLLLSQKGIDINVIDNNGKRPIDLANDETIIKLFKI